MGSLYSPWFSPSHHQVWIVAFFWFFSFSSQIHSETSMKTRNKKVAIRWYWWDTRSALLFLIQSTVLECNRVTSSSLFFYFFSARRRLWLIPCCVINAFRSVLINQHVIKVANRWIITFCKLYNTLGVTDHIYNYATELVRVDWSVEIQHVRRLELKRS